MGNAPNSQLLEASRGGRLADAEKAIKAGADIDTVYQVSITALRNVRIRAVLTARHTRTAARR